jgi:hypothetical protein
VARAETTSTLFTMIFEIFQSKKIEEQLGGEISKHFKTKEDFSYENLKSVQLLD